MIFAYIVALVALLDMEHVKPQPVSPHQTLAECQKAAGEMNEQYKDELKDPENVEKGLRFVCFKLQSDA